MGEWCETILADLCSDGGFIQTGPFGSQLHASDYIPFGGVPVVMPKDLKDSRIDLGTIARVREEDAVRLSRHRMRPGDLVYSRRGDIERHGRVGPEEDGFLCGTGCLLVRPDAQVNSQFLSYQLNTSRTKKWLHGHAVGATMPNLNTNILGALPIRMPDASTQAAIVSILGAIDGKIESNRRAVQVAHELGRALVDAAVEKNTVELRALVNHRRDQVNPWEDGVAPVRHFSLPAFDQGQQPDITKSTSIKSAKFTIKKPSVLFSKLNPITPRVWIAKPDNQIKSYASTEFLVLEPNTISPEMLWLVCAQSQVSNRLAGLARGTSNSHQRVNPADILGQLVIDPTTLPNAVISKGEGLIKYANSIHSEIPRLMALRDTLLPGLMEGVLSIHETEHLVGQVI